MMASLKAICLFFGLFMGISFKAKKEKSDLFIGSSLSDSGGITSNMKLTDNTVLGMKLANTATEARQSTSLHRSTERPHIVPFCVKLQALPL